jgi:hypothetical protein
VSKIELELVVENPDPMAADVAGDSLLDELSLLDFDRLDRACASPVPGTRSAGVVAAGTLVGLLSSPMVLRAAVDVVKSWLMRQDRGSVTITCGKDKLTLSNPSRADQEALVAAFVKKHTGS